MSKRILCHLTLVLLLVSLVPIGLHFSSQNASAGTNHWFVGVTSQNAADASAWLPATVPSTGDDIYFSALSINDCNWNLAGSFGAFNLLANYTKTVTQPTAFTVISYTQAGGAFHQGANVVVNGATAISGGTLTGSTSYTWTNAGNVARTAGTITLGNLKLIMTQDGTSITGFPDSIGFGSLQISANVTVGDATKTIAYSLTVDSGKTMTIGNGLSFMVQSYLGGAGALSNSGIIAGTGTFLYYTYSPASVTRTFGVINTPIILCSFVAGGSITLGAAATFGSTLLVLGTDGAVPGATQMLDLSASNFALSANGITIGTQATINGRGNVITDSGNWDSSAGTFTQGTSSVHLTGISKTLKVNGGMFQNLFVDSGASYTLQSNVKTYNYWKNGTVTLGGYTMTVNNDQAPVFTSSPTTSINFEQSYSYDANAYDREGETLTFGLSSDLPGVSINSTTGIITKTQPLANGSFYMDVSVTDGNHTVYQNYTLTTTNQFPYFTSVPVVTMTEGDHYSYQANATDSEGYSITYGMTTTAPFLSSISIYGYFSGTPSTAEAGTYYVNISASDGYRVTYQNYSLEVKTRASQVFTPQLLISLIFGFGLVGLGLKAKEFWILAGLVWVFCGLTVFLSYGTPYMVMTSMFGIVLMFGGLYDVWK